MAINTEPLNFQVFTNRIIIAFTFRKVQILLELFKSHGSSEHIFLD